MQPSVKSKGPADAFGRPLLNLRISVTDRCNLRCRYCMPEEEYGWLPREKLLSFEEISELAGIFTEVGIEKVRLTGATREEIKSLIVSQWVKRTDRGAEERKDLVSRGVLVGIEQLRKDPHLENAHAGRLGATLLRAF